MALLKLQKQMVEGSEGAAKFVIAYHYADALRTLDAFKLVNNVQVKDEAARLKTAWDGLKLTAEAQERDELLSQFDNRIAKGLMDRVAHAAGQPTQAAQAAQSAQAAASPADRSR